MGKRLIMIAGPNGAGKTTMSLELIASDGSVIYEFVNADEIAKGLAPLHPETKALDASKLMVKRLKELLTNQKNFAFETTGAGVNYIKHLNKAKSQGYDIHLTFLWLASPDEAIKRVAQRVKQGGHHIPEDTVIRRYYLGIKNFLNHYLHLADTVHVMNNSSESNGKELIACKEKDRALEIIDRMVWDKIKRAANDR